MGTQLCVFWHPVSLLFRPFSTRVPLKVPWLVLVTRLALFWLLGLPFGLHFGIEKPPQQREKERERERENKRERNIFSSDICLHTRFCSRRLAGGRRPPRCGCTFTSCNHRNRCTSALEIDLAHANSTHVTYL